MVNFAAMTFRGEELYSDSNIDLDPELKIHAILKDGDTKADLTIENSRMIAEGTKKEIKDYNLKLGWGPRMLRNLKFGGMVPRLMKMGVISKLYKYKQLSKDRLNQFVITNVLIQ